MSASGWALCLCLFAAMLLPVEAAVADDPVLLLRVKKDRLPVEYVKISRHREFFPTWQEFGASVEEFARIVKEWGITNVSEGGQLEPRIEQWRKGVKAHKEG